MRALALVALLTACGASDGTHFADPESADGSADTGSDAGTDGSLGAPTGGFDGEPRRQSSGDGLAAAGSSGLGTQPTGGSSGGDDSGGAGGSSGGSTDGDATGGSGGSSSGSTDGGSSGGTGGAGDSSTAGGSSDSTTGAQGVPCAEPLTPQTSERNGDSGPFGTTEGVCYRVEFAPVQNEAHWACPGADDRSLTINGVPFDCSGLPLPAQPIDGAYYFEFGPGDNAEAYLIWKIWNAL